VGGSARRRRPSSANTRRLWTGRTLGKDRTGMSPRLRPAPIRHRAGRAAELRRGRCDLGRRVLATVRRRPPRRARSFRESGGRAQACRLRQRSLRRSSPRTRAARPARVLLGRSRGRSRRGWCGARRECNVMSTSCNPDSRRVTTAPARQTSVSGLAGSATPSARMALEGIRHAAACRDAMAHGLASRIGGRDAISPRVVQSLMPALASASSVRRARSAVATPRGARRSARLRPPP
jgi:hypothetical protein